MTITNHRYDPVRNTYLGIHFTCGDDSSAFNSFRSFRKKLLSVKDCQYSSDGSKVTYIKYCIMQ